MAKQSLFYEDVIPITKERHAGWSVTQGKDYAFAAEAHSVPLMYSEFQQACVAMPIVFGENNDSYTPLAMLGMQPNKSLMIDGEGAYTGEYCPAFLRRYPYIFARAPNAEEEQFALCVDETYSGVDKTGKAGEALFGDDEEPSDYLKKVMEFARVYEIELRKTAALMTLLKDYELLDPMNATITLKSGEKISLTRFFVVSQERFRALDAEKVAALHENGAIELICYHRASLKTMERLRDMVA